MTVDNNRFTDTPSGIPFYIERSPRQVQDPACQDSVDQWAGANAVTFRLLAALESLRDLRIVLADLVGQDKPDTDRRRIKRISTPLYAFAWSVQNICTELIDSPDSYGGLSDEFIVQVRGYHDEMVRVVPLSGDSPLRTVRNKIDAHVDPETVLTPGDVWGHVELNNFIPWLGCSLVVFSQLLILDVYGWTCESTHPNVFRLMSVDGTLVDLLMVDGQPSKIVGVAHTTSPKVEIAQELNAVITLHNTLLQSLPVDSAE